MIKNKYLLITGIILFAAAAVYEAIWLIPFLLKINPFNGVHFILTGIIVALSTTLIFIAVKKNKIIKAIYAVYLVGSILLVILGILNLCAVWNPIV